MAENDSNIIVPFSRRWNTIGARVSPPRYDVSISFFSSASTSTFISFPFRFADRNHTIKFLPVAACTRLARCINNAYATPKKCTVRYYRTDSHRRSAIITSLLHKMKVSQCYFTPTRQGNLGKERRSRDSEAGRSPDSMAKIVTVSNSCLRHTRVVYDTSSYRCTSREIARVWVQSASVAMEKNGGGVESSDW